MSDEEYFEAFVALFWSAFGKGAGMPFELTCLAEAKRPSHHNGLGYYDNVWKNVQVFLTNPSEQKRALRCCERAGHLAASYALRDGQETIGVDNFVAACQKVEEQHKRAIKRLTAESKSQVNFAGVCG